MDIDVTVTLANDTDEEMTVRIPAGSIFEAAQTDFGVQNVAVVTDDQIRIAPKSKARVVMTGRCLNRMRSVPNSTPGRPTPFRYSGPSMDQTEIWNRVSSPTGGSSV